VAEEKAFNARLVARATNALSSSYMETMKLPHPTASPSPLPRQICVSGKPREDSRPEVPFLGAGPAQFAACPSCRRPGSPAIGARRWGGMCARPGIRWFRWSHRGSLLIPPCPKLEATAALRSQRINAVVVLCQLPQFARPSGDPAACSRRTSPGGQPSSAVLRAWQANGYPLNFADASSPQPPTSTALDHTSHDLQTPRQLADSLQERPDQRVDVRERG